MNSPANPSSQRDAAGGDVASPCISVCVLIQPQNICAGCFRTLDEIAQWSVLDAGARRAVLAALPARRAAFAPPHHSPDADAKR